MTSFWLLEWTLERTRQAVLLIWRYCGSSPSLAEATLASTKIRNRLAHFIALIRLLNI
jgi:hypothetical protein